MDEQAIKEWIDQNLLTKQEAIEITRQSLTAFNQTIESGRLTAFYDHGEGRGRVRLYLKSDVETYAHGLEERRSRFKNK